MSYLLNLELPLWWFFLPLIISLYLAAKYYKWKAKYYDLSDRYNKAKSEYQKSVEVLNSKSQKDAEIIRKLNSEAVEREVLIMQLRKDLDISNDLYDRQSEVIKRSQQTIISSLAEIEALKVICKRTIRGRKQLEKYEAEKVAKRKAQAKTIMDDGKIEGVVYDSLGTPRITLADQPESYTARNIVNLSIEVTRGIKEQAEAIQKEIEKDGVDMSQLEKGDKIKLRRGIIETVESVEYRSSHSNYPYLVNVGRFNLLYGKNGCFDYLNNGKGENDIVQIIKQPKQPIFNPQVGELVALVDSQDFFSVIRIDNGRYLLSKSEVIRTTPPLNRPFQDLKPIKGNNYKNGYRVGYCYKTKKPCDFDCDGLCKNS